MTYEILTYKTTSTSVQIDNSWYLNRYMKIHKFQGDIEDIAKSIKESVALDTEATVCKIERDKLSLIQLCDKNGEAGIIQPDRKNYKALILYQS